MIPSPRLHPALATVCLLLVLTAGGTSPSTAAEPGAEGEAAWAQWGGPNRDFTVEDAGLAATWPEGGPNELWSRELGGGYSAILAEDGRLYTGYRRDGEEVLAALDAATGKTLWEDVDAVEPLEDQTRDFGLGPNATPILAGDKVCLVGFTSRLRCVDKATGERAWDLDLRTGVSAKVHGFGYSNAPILYGGMLVVLTGGDRYGAIGLDLADGSLRWQTPPLDTSYSSPVLIRWNDEDQLVFMAPTEVLAVGMSDGKVRWRHPHKNRFSNNCAGPWWSEREQLLFVSSQADGGSQTLHLTLQDGETAIREVAEAKKFRIFHNNALRRGETIYGADGQFLVAHDLKFGKDHWRERGFPGANLVAAGERVIALDENGELSLLGLSTEGVEVHGRHKVLEKPAWTAPTLVGTHLYLRDTKRIVALDLGASGVAGASQADAPASTGR